MKTEIGGSDQIGRDVTGGGGGTGPFYIPTYGGTDQIGRGDGGSEFI